MRLAAFTFVVALVAVFAAILLDHTVLAAVAGAYAALAGERLLEAVAATIEPTSRRSRRLVRRIQRAVAQQEVAES
jgi:hypothetical protein